MITKFDSLQPLVVAQFAVAALSARRPAVRDRRYKTQIAPLPSHYSEPGTQVNQYSV
jgi:hypothetical protein